MTQLKDHFSSLASHYAEFRPHYPKALFEYLAELCPQRLRAWDCACGSGQASVSIAQHFESVLSTDASAQQIAQATPHPRVQYQVGSAEHSALERESVDLVTVAQALHWFEIDRFYTEVNRVLKTDGILAVWCYGVQRHANEDLDREIQVFITILSGRIGRPNVFMWRKVTLPLRFLSRN